MRVRQKHVLPRTSGIFCVPKLFIEDIGKFDSSCLKPYERRMTKFTFNISFLSTKNVSVSRPYQLTDKSDRFLHRCKPAESYIFYDNTLSLWASSPFRVASEASGEAARDRGKGLLSFSTPRTRMSFRVRLLPDFSRLPQNKSLLAGYTTLEAGEGHIS